MLVWYENSENLKCRRKSERRTDTDGHTRPCNHLLLMLWWLLPVVIRRNEKLASIEI